jgi:hypothetical protein
MREPHLASEDFVPQDLVRGSLVSSSMVHRSEVVRLVAGNKSA